MDFSAANIPLWNTIIQLGIIAAAILLANVLRRKVTPIRKTLMPTAVLGGFLILIGRWLGLININGDLMETLVYHAIALGFIAMSLRTTRDSERDVGLTGAKTGAIIVGSYLIQAVAGLLISLGLAATLMPSLFPAAGILLPMGYGQGPGQANNVGGTYEALGFVGGRSFGLSLAATGYLCACIVGVLMLNLLAAKGRVRRKESEELSGSVTVDHFQDQNEIPISESVDRFSVQFALVLFCYLATYLVTWGITSFLSAYAPGLGKTLNSLLWGFNFIVGSALAIGLRALLSHMRRTKLMTHQYQNNYLLSRISGAFFDIMIVAGIATINIADLKDLWLPFALMAITGGVITWYYLAWICKRTYPGYYYEGLLSLYGMMTGTISSGILLLREIDPEYRTPAANNLILGSGFGILFGAPVLILVGLGPSMPWVVLGLCAVYFAMLVVFVYKAGQRKELKK